MSNSKAVTRGNFINKLCFVRFGSATDVDMKLLRAELNRALQTSASAITRQSINGWFNGARPGSAGAYVLFNEYLTGSEHFSAGAFVNSQKKVLRQLRLFVKQEIEKEITKGDIGFHGKNLTIKQNKICPPEIYEEESSRISGFYNIYRPRYDEGGGYISREFLHLTKAGFGLIARYWTVLPNDKKIKELRGATVFAGDSAWVFSYGADADHRLRVITFNKRGMELSNRRMGLLMTYGAHHERPTPISCRIYLERVANISNLNKHLIDFIRIESREEFEKSRNINRKIAKKLFQDAVDGIDGIIDANEF